ncbi:MAG: FAD-dependent oxidoreductase, partial [Gammaproteobacteria bacterium]|nr:FAD-dependent oxidoreductase [Gammaproteobacteria bacterium]
MSEQIFTDNFKAQSFWWDRSPRPEPGGEALLEKADVVIVGSGYTGLCAAIQTGRGGQHTV